MILTLLITIGLSLVAWLYLRWSKVRSFWANRKVPHLPPHPIWGSLIFLQQINVGLWLRQMYQRFKSYPYFGIWLFWRPCLVVNCPELARNILVKDADNFRNRFLSSGSSDPIGALNLFTVDDPLWSKMRRRLTPLFTSSKLRGLHGLISSKSKEIVQRIKNENEAGNVINLRVLYADFTTDVVGISSFGVKSDATLTGESQMRLVTKDFMKYSFLRGIGWTSIFFLPSVVDIFGFSLFPKASTEYFRKIYRAVTTQREKEGSNHKDLMDALIKIKREAEANNEELSEDTLIAQAAIFLQGGFDTSASTLTYITYELAHNPEVQEKLYSELLETKEKLNGQEFDADILANMPYLNAVINEVLRLYPPMGFLDRIAAKDYKVDENLTIPAGTPIYVNAIGMHVDERYFPNPMKFNPDRFLPENEGNIKPFTYMPFGEGPRICIGQRFSYNTMRCAMASVFFNYQVRPRPSAPKPSECEVEKNGIFFMPSEFMAVEFIPRT